MNLKFWVPFSNVSQIRTIECGQDPCDWNVLVCLLHYAWLNVTRFRQWHFINKK